MRVVDDQYGSPTYAPHLAAGDRPAHRAPRASAPGIWPEAGETSWYELTRELFRLRGVTVAVTPVKTSEFPRPAQRPRRAPLVSVREEPHLRLPAWPDGLREFASAID